MISVIVIFIWMMFCFRSSKGTRSKSTRIQNPPDQNPPSQIREPLTERG